MEEHRRPFAQPGEDRLPTLVWPWQIPIGGEPVDVVEICADYAAWLPTTDALQPGGLRPGDRASDRRLALTAPVRATTQGADR